MLFRSLSCLGWPCSDFIYHAVVSGVREHPGGATQCLRIPSGDCPGHLELCPGDRAKPAFRHPSVSQGSTEFQAWTAPSHHHGAHLVRSVSPAYGYFFHLAYTCTIRHIGMPLTVLLVAVRRQYWIGYHRQDLLLPFPLAAVVNQDRHRLPHLIRIRMVQFVHLIVPSISHGGSWTS